MILITAVLELYPRSLHVTGDHHGHNLPTQKHSNRYFAAPVYKRVNFYGLHADSPQGPIPFFFQTIPTAGYFSQLRVGTTFPAIPLSSPRGHGGFSPEDRNSTHRGVFGEWVPQY